MARNSTVEVSAETWTQLTNGDVTSITFQNLGSNFVLVKATNGATAPTNTEGAFRYNPGQGERNVDLTDLFSGVSSANRVWAYSTVATRVAVSHG